MQQGARIRSAAEVVEEIVRRHRPASAALADWAKGHRFAGSGDRAAIGNLVYDVLRQKLSLAARMGSEEPRALVLAAAASALGMTPAEVIAAADGSKHALASPSEAEASALHGAGSDRMPEWVMADVPKWLWSSFMRAFGDDAVRQGQALALRAPVDLRVNTLVADRPKVIEALSRFSAEPCRFAPHGIRLPAPAEGRRQANVEAEPAHGLGWFEVQDEGSQIAAAMTSARAGMQVLDYCAGAGGKTLALAAMMDNQGRVVAFDRDRHQLRPIFDRLKRAGVANVEVPQPGSDDALEPLVGACDVVLVDAPCSGSGTWRRRPDIKWRVRPASLVRRQSDQRAVLGEAIRYVKPGGRLVYVTCSVLPEENCDTVNWLVATYGEFAIVPWQGVWREEIGGEPPVSADGRTDTLLLTPATHGTDGFFIAVLERRC